MFHPDWSMICESDEKSKARKWRYITIITLPHTKLDGARFPLPPTGIPIMTAKIAARFTKT